MNIMRRPAKAIAKRRLQKVLDEIPELRQRRRGSPEFDKWHRDTKVAIANTFVESSTYVEDFNGISYSLSFAIAGMPDSDYQRAYTRGLGEAAAILESMIDEIEEYWEDYDQVQDSSKPLHTNQLTNEHQVFIIHGRDYGTKDTVARFLESLDLEPVTLQEQPDQGRTIIEKFEEYAQIDFAVALFTPDDLGGLDDGGNNLHPRTRQNVIFELGYFIGKFGRNRVRVLVKGNIEIPSDYSGVIYVELGDSDSWKMDLFKELKSAGFDIDANRLF